MNKSKASEEMMAQQSKDKALKKTRYPLARLFVYTIFFIVVTFFAATIIRSIFLETFFPHRNINKQAAIHSLTPKERKQCNAFIKGLHTELRTQFYREIRDPWYGVSPDERWNSWLPAWIRRKKLWAPKCAIPGEQVLQEQFKKLERERQGYQKLIQAYLDHVRPHAIVIDDFLKNVGELTNNP